MTSNRFAISVSLFIHFIGFLFAMFYVIETKHDVEDYVAVDFSRAKRPSKLRRRLIPYISKIQQVNPAEVQPPRIKPAVSTIAEIPIDDAEFALPQGDIFQNSLNTPSDSITLTHADILIQTNSPPRIIQPQRPQPKIVLDTSPKFQIISKIESTTDVANLMIIEIPTTSETIEPPKFIHKVVPKYPEIAKRAEKEGIVILEAEIGIDGIARDIKVIQKLGYGCDEAAIEALKTSQFLPAKKNKIPIAVRIQIPYRFQFED